MKNTILIIAVLMSSLILTAQDITNTVGLQGKFIVLSNDENVKLLIRDNDYLEEGINATNIAGEFNLYLDGGNMFIRDGNFEYEPGQFSQYDYLFIDGKTGRIGFNILHAELPLTSSVHLQGSIATRVRILDGSNNYIIKQDDHIMILNKVDNSTTIMTLPTMGSSHGREYIFKRNGTHDGVIKVVPQSGEKLNGVIDGSISLKVDNSSLEVVCDKVTGWWILSELSAVSFSQPITSDITVGDDDLLQINFTSDGQEINLSLPDVIENKGRFYEIKRNTDGEIFTGNVLNIKPVDSQKMDQFDSTTPYQMLNNWESVIIRSNGEKWLIMSNYNH